MILIAVVKNIVPKKAKKEKSSYGLNENESYNLV